MTWYVQLIRLDRGIRAGPKTRALLADDSYQKILCTEDGLSAVCSDTKRRFWLGDLSRWLRKS
jgi:hypothetical protein